MENVICWLHLQTVWSQIRAYKMLGLIWILAVWHWLFSWKNFSKKLILKKKSADHKKHAKFPVGKDLLYPANLEFCRLLAGWWSLKIVWTQKGPTEHPTWSKAKLFDILMLFPKEIFEKSDVEEYHSNSYNFHLLSLKTQTSLCIQSYSYQIFPLLRKKVLKSRAVQEQFMKFS